MSAGPAGARPLDLPGWVHTYSGKVRDLFVPAPGSPAAVAHGDVVLVVASDRISAFDHVLPTTIPDKGRVLTQLTLFWFDRLEDLVGHHLVSADPGPAGVPDAVAGRAMVCRRLDMFPVECVARGYLTGSGWAEYQATGAVCGIGLPDGLVESQQLPEPIFTPATKAEQGEHDENIDFERAAGIVGPELAARLRDVTLDLYRRGAAHARERGIILADTKFEFGLVDGRLTLIDEVLTPDSSRFWPADEYEPGRAQRSFDKQYVRDWLATQAWDRTAPGPELPPEVVDRTRERYVQAYELLTGTAFDEWTG